MVNAAAFGWSSYQGVRRLEEMLKLDPDLVLFSFGANDCQHVVRSDAEFAEDFQCIAETYNLAPERNFHDISKQNVDGSENLNVQRKIRYTVKQKNLCVLCVPCASA